MKIAASQSPGCARGREASQPKAGQAKPGLRRCHGLCPWGATKAVVFLCFWTIAGTVFGTPALKEGDIVFQDLPCAQSAAIQLATHSPYSHVGVIILKNGKPFVYEAVGPVKYTSLKDWIKQGSGSHFVARRLKDSAKVLTPKVLQKMREVAEHFKGKAYDWTFGWSDDKVYCSELVWKIYKRAVGLEIGKLQRLRDFDLSRPEVRAQLKEKYGDHVPWNEKVISPAGMFDSDLLVTVLK